MIKFWFAQLYVCGMESSIFCWNYSWGVKTLGNGWSKSFFLEDKVVLNFDFKLGAKKTGHLDRPLWTNIFQYISIYFTRSWFTLFHHQQDKNKSERPVVALAVKKYQLLTHWLTDSLTHWLTDNFKSRDASASKNVISTFKTKGGEVNSSLNNVKNMHW